MTSTEIEEILTKANVNFELIRQDKPILTVEDAKEFYPIEKSAPTFILQSENGLVACITSFQNGRLDFAKLKELFGFIKLKMADKEKIKNELGYEVGTVPFFNLNIPCLFDNKLLKHDVVYGGTGDALLTLKIDPNDILKINNIIGRFE